MRLLSVSGLFAKKTIFRAHNLERITFFRLIFYLDVSISVAEAGGVSLILIQFFGYRCFCFFLSPRRTLWIG